jgi:hypothetical protein
VVNSTRHLAKCTSKPTKLTHATGIPLS